MRAPDDDKYLDDDKYCSEILEILKQKSDCGNKAAVLLAVYQCALMRKPLPEWLRAAFINAYESAARFEIRSWDEAFGPPQEKGAHLATRKQHAELRFDILWRVHELAASGQSIDEEMFEKIADELGDRGVGIAGGTVSDIYYDERTQELREMIEPFLPKSNSEKKRK
jgi:hypothetical protein